MKFLSHLELMKAWERAFRREEIPLLFSSGYSPRPMMTFALPTAVGIIDLAGYMDVHVKDATEPAKFLRMKSLPEGLSIHSAKAVEETKVSLMSLVDSAEYRVEGDLEALHLLHTEEALPFVRTNKRGRLYARNARDYILHFHIEERALRIHLSAGSERSIRVSELLEALCSDADAHVRYDVTRLEVYDKEGRSLWER